jgi:hypothetical protein
MLSQPLQQPRCSTCGHSFVAVGMQLPTEYMCMQRIYETSHVHKFSHATMPIFNLIRNCSYYWLFAAFVSYNINHPQYTEPPAAQVFAAFALAYCCQVCGWTHRNKRSTCLAAHQHGASPQCVVHMHHSSTKRACVFRAYQIHTSGCRWAISSHTSV